MKLFTRKEKEDREHKLKELGLLSPEYTFSSESKGRLKPEDHESEWRTDFERDNDRIIHSRAAHRQKDKTQVVLLPVEPHLTTRMTHTSDVIQIACGQCSYLGLNEKLAEAIARGHDLGHTPFGHAGESALTTILRKLLGDPTYIFHHAKYGIDIVDRIEKDGKGLNLTLEVRNGILKHTLGAASIDSKLDLPYTPEGRVVMRADKLAYTFSDLDDALRVGIIQESDIPQAELKVLGPRKSKWIGNSNYAVVTSSIDAQEICFRGEFSEAFEAVRHFMYKNVYGSGRMQAEFEKAKRLIGLVFEHVMDNQFKNLEQKEAAFKTLDVVACMTDRSIVKYFEDNFIPRGPY